MIRALSLPRDAVVGVVGVGPGVFALPLARHLKEGLVYGVDVEPRPAANCRTSSALASAATPASRS